MNTVFITGAGGFIGRHLVAELLKRELTIKVLMLDEESVPKSWPSTVQIIRGDIRHLAKLSDEIGVFDTIFHLAAIVSDWGARQEHVDITVHGTEQAIALCLKNNAQFIVTTSIAAFASTLGQGVIDETSPCGKPASNYEYVKQKQEQVTLDAVKQLGLKAAIIRPANVYGVGSVWVNRFVDLINQQQPVLMGKGDWDAGLVHVNHVVQILILAAEHTQLPSGEVYIIADDPGVTWQQYLGALSAHLNLPTAKSIPNLVAKIAAPILEYIGTKTGQKKPPVVTNLAYRLMGVNTIFSNRKAKQQLGFKPTINLAQAMAEIKNTHKQ